MYNTIISFLDFTSGVLWSSLWLTVTGLHFYPYDLNACFSVWSEWGSECCKNRCRS